MPIRTLQLLACTLLLTGWAMAQDKDLQNQPYQKDRKVIIIDGDRISINGKDMLEALRVDSLLENARGLMLRMDRPDFLQNLLGDVYAGPADKRARLGIQMEKDEKGVLITAVLPGSAAEKAALQKGDIITRIDRQKLESPEALQEYINGKKAGDQIRLYYTREGKKKEVLVTLEEASGIAGLRTFLVPAERFSDEELKKMIGDLPGMGYGLMEGRWGKQRLGLQVEELPDEKGLKVVEVQAGSSADRAGLRKGDIITAIGKQPIQQLEDLRAALEKEPAQLQLQILREGKQMELSVPFKKLRTASF